MWLCKGEDGEAVVIDKDKLSSDNRSKFDTGWQNNAFNQFASDMISLHRSLPDIRDEGFVADAAAAIVTAVVVTSCKKNVSLGIVCLSVSLLAG